MNHLQLKHLKDQHVNVPSPTRPEENKGLSWEPEVSKGNPRFCLGHLPLIPPHLAKLMHNDDAAIFLHALHAPSGAKDPWPDSGGVPSR